MMSLEKKIEYSLAGESFIDIHKLSNDCKVFARKRGFFLLEQHDKTLIVDDRGCAINMICVDFTETKDDFIELCFDPMNVIKATKWIIENYNA